MDPVRKEMLMALSKEKLIDYIDMSAKNFWTLQNNHISWVEERYGLKVATEFDEQCIAKAAAVQVHRMKKLLELPDALETLKKFFYIGLMNLTMPMRIKDVNSRCFRQTVINCPGQLKRLELGLPLINCKPGLPLFNEAVSKAVSPRIKSRVVFAPPDPRVGDAWCEHEFEIEP